MSTKPSAEDLKTRYWHYLLTEGKRPSSVYAFTQREDMDEAVFYQHFSSFDALEATYWEQLIEETVEILHQDDEYSRYPANEKLLAFYYTFFSSVQKNRSRLVEYFPCPGRHHGTTHLMRQRFIEFARDVVQSGVQETLIADRKKLTERYPALLFEQLRVLIEFYRKDSSADFQDTDAFIEKTVRFSTDMARSGAFDSAFDLGRFFLRRFIPSNK